MTVKRGGRSRRLGMKDETCSASVASGHLCGGLVRSRHSPLRTPGSSLSRVAGLSSCSPTPPGDELHWSVAMQGWLKKKSPKTQGSKVKVVDVWQKR